MNPTNQRESRRIFWPAFGLTAAFVCAALRRWQLATAFEEDTGLAIPGAQGSVILICVLVMAAAGFTILAVTQPLPMRAHRWNQVFLGGGEPVYPILVILASALSLAAIPILLKAGWGQWQAYQEAIARQDPQPPSNNGILTIATAVGALLSALGLLQMGRDGLHPGRRGKGGFSSALPGMAGCVWLMESFRAHASNPVHWVYAPLLLSIVCGMLLYVDFTAMSADSAKPRRLLWMAAMTLTLSAPAMVSTVTDGAWGDMLLLASQCMTAMAVLWRLPPNLERPPKFQGNFISRPGKASIEEETTDE